MEYEIDEEKNLHQYFQDSSNGHSPLQAIEEEGLEECLIQDRLHQQRKVLEELSQDYAIQILTADINEEEVKEKLNEDAIGNHCQVLTFEILLKARELLSQEKKRMELQFEEAVAEQAKVAREESEKLIQEQLVVLQSQLDRQLSEDRVAIRRECLEELKSEREVKLQKKLREQISKKLEAELLSKLPMELEGQVREELRETVMREIEEANKKQLGQMRRKLQIQRQDMEIDLQEKLKRDFELEVRLKAEEMARGKEKELVKKYKGMFEKERKCLEERLRSEMDSQLSSLRAQVQEEKIEVSRLKSLELVRLKKMEEQRKAMEEELRVAKLEVWRKKASMEQEQREKKIREMDRAQNRKKTPLRSGAEYLEQQRVLDQDPGTKVLSQQCHVTVKNLKHKLEQADDKERFIFEEQQLMQSPSIYNQDESQQNTSHFNSGMGPLSEQKSPMNFQLRPICLSQESTLPQNNILKSIVSQKNGPELETTRDSEDIKRGKLFPYVKPTDSREVISRMIQDSISKYKIQSHAEKQENKMNQENMPPEKKSAYLDYLQKKEQKRSKKEVKGEQRTERCINPLQFTAIMQAYLDKSLTIAEVDLLDKFMNKHLAGNGRAEEFVEDVVKEYVKQKKSGDRLIGKTKVELKELLYGSLPYKDIEKIGYKN